MLVKSELMQTGCYTLICRKPGDSLQRTGQDITGQDITGQDITGQDITGQGITGQDITGQGLTGQDITGQGITCLLYTSDAADDC